MFSGGDPAFEPRSNASRANFSSELAEAAAASANFHYNRMQNATVIPTSSHAGARFAFRRCLGSVLRRNHDLVLCNDGRVGPRPSRFVNRTHATPANRRHTPGGLRLAGAGRVLRSHHDTEAASRARILCRRRPDIPGGAAHTGSARNHVTEQEERTRAGEEHPRSAIAKNRAGLPAALDAAADPSRRPTAHTQVQARADRAEDRAAAAILASPPTARSHDAISPRWPTTKRACALTVQHAALAANIGPTRTTFDHSAIARTA